MQSTCLPKDEVDHRERQMEQVVQALLAAVEEVVADPALTSHSATSARAGTGWSLNFRFTQCRSRARLDISAHRGQFARLLEQNQRSLPLFLDRHVLGYAGGWCRYVVDRVWALGGH